MAGVIDTESRADAGAFLSRLLRLDAAAVVRLRPAEAGTVAGGVSVWAHLPFGVLVTRTLRADVGRDVTVRAGDLLAAVRDGTGLPAAHDADWRWPLPPSAGEEIEQVPADEVRRLADAAADTARTALGEGVAGRAVGSRRIRDALLDHVPIVIDVAGVRLDVPQRLVQAIVRMGFLRDAPATVRRAGPWVGFAGEFGAAWYRPIGETLSLHVSPYRSNG